jgi:hypothetical protein
MCIRIYVSIHLCVYASMHLYIYVSMHLYIYVSMHLCVYTSTGVGGYEIAALAVGGVLHALEEVINGSYLSIYLSITNLYY